MFDDLFGHKTSFLPKQRNMYFNLHQTDNNRFGKQQYFEDLETLQERIVVPTEDRLNMVDMRELFVKIEFRAVMKIKLVFMMWFHQLTQNTLNMVHGDCDTDHRKKDHGAVKTV